MSTQEERDEVNEMIGFNRMPKIDMGTAVTPDEKDALWSEDDEKRQRIVESNGNDGDHYEVDYLNDLTVNLKGGDTVAVARGLHLTGVGTVWDVIKAGKGD